MISMTEETPSRLELQHSVFTLGRIMTQCGSFGRRLVEWLSQHMRLHESLLLQDAKERDKYMFELLLLR